MSTVEQRERWREAKRRSREKQQSENLEQYMENNRMQQRRFRKAHPGYYGKYYRARKAIQNQEKETEA